MKTDSAQLQPYLEAGWQLIPLHRHDHYDEHKGKRRERGKSPLHPNWTRRPYRSEEQVAHMERGDNVGVRLRATDLVLDVDPRAFPDGQTMQTDNPFKRLCRDVGLEPDDYPTVETGSGGLHLYMTKPDDVSVRDSLPDYEGVEFKTLGRQVVSAGSIHPTTKRTYAWDFLTPTLAEAPAAPQRLVNLIRRPGRAAGDRRRRAHPGGTGGDARPPRPRGLPGARRLAHPDAGLPPRHRGRRPRGVRRVVHQGPRVLRPRRVVGRRWDSLHSDNDGGARVTHRTLHKLLRDAGAEDAIPRPSAVDDFEAVGPDDLPDGAMDGPVEEHEKKGRSSG
ncbi:bifunctional DNA primase/polymerase [Brucella abortus]|nr:bifunctional DNA primase/polymerase [Brucella abortus]